MIPFMWHIQNRHIPKGQGVSKWFAGAGEGDGGDC